jgi:cation diffusion facilitator CzcD-associated flavoprotein CzcO
VVALPDIDPVAHLMRRFLPAPVAYGLTRLKQYAQTGISYEFFRRQPGIARALLQGMAGRQLPDGYVEKHFTPSYNPWDERLCVVPNGDLFKAIRSGRASVVTDHIETFTETGIKLKSGEELHADIIITATGLVLQALGAATGSVDGVPIDFAQEISYKGVMYSGVPNLATTFGYINASWTLKADLISTYVCRTLKYMDKHGYDYIVPEAPPADDELKPFVEMQSGYFQRGMHLLPKQGTRAPWRVYQNYVLDTRMLRFGPVDDGVRLGSATEQVAEPSELVSV